MGTFVISNLRYLRWEAGKFSDLEKNYSQTKMVCEKLVWAAVGSESTKAGVCEAILPWKRVGEE